MRLLALALLATTFAAAPALAQDAGGADGGPSPTRTDQDNRYLEIPGEMTPDARATIPATPLLAVAPNYSPMPQYAQVPTSGAPPVGSRILDRQDEIFLHEIAAAGMTEVEFGQLAQQRAGNPSVRDFGRQMVEDHGKANARLNAMVQTSEIKLPTAMNPTYKKGFDDLTRLQGAAFDRAYIKGQIDDHTRVAQMLEHQIAHGKDPQLKAFAAETLPTVRHHLEIAHTLQTRVQTSQR
ncbi:MAG: DUF4142 domain-containing protein [Rhodospirillaceae bacterium]|nr:DUF4142 domain-containing protein [Rhodospirillaceae bacterium]